VKQVVSDGSVVFDVQTDAASPDFEIVRAQIERVLSLDSPADEFLALGDRDTILRQLQDLAPGLRPPLFYSPYEVAGKLYGPTRWGSDQAPTFARFAELAKQWRPFRTWAQVYLRAVGPDLLAG
jgi:3-methyladenine DNA glycosylase/8-oxoguanine DNA glycosylase